LVKRLWIYLYGLGLNIKKLPEFFICSNPSNTRH